jgi:hypothetical protein
MSYSSGETSGRNGRRGNALCPEDCSKMRWFCSSRQVVVL